MAFKLGNDIVLHDADPSSGILSRTNIDQLQINGIEVLAHDGLGNITLRNVILEQSTVDTTGFTTDDIAEGTNLYFTSARVDAIIDPQIAAATADRMAIRNEYAVADTALRLDLDTEDASIRADFAAADAATLASAQAYADSVVSTGTGSLTTDDISEGANLYYTDARVNTLLATKNYATESYADTVQSNAYAYTDSQVTKTVIDNLNIQAASVDTNSVTLGTDTTGNYVATVAGTTSEIDVAGSGTETAGVTLSLPNNMVVPQNLTVTGDLTVNGTTITNDTSTLSVDDPYVTVGGNTAPTSDDNKDRGVRFRWYDTAANIGFFGFDDSTGRFTFIPDATESGEVFSGTKGDLDVGAVFITDAVTDNSHAATKLYVDTAETDAVATANAYTDSQISSAGLTAGTGISIVSGTVTNTAPFTQTNFDNELATKSTTDLSEGTNLYYTNARVDARIPTNVSAFTNDAGYVTTTYSAGNGIGLSSATFSVAAGNGLTQQADGLAMSGSYTGNFTATGDVTAYSDRRFKHNIETIENGLDIINRLRGVSYDKDQRSSVGVIAQEVEEVLPQVVHTDDEGMKSVAYGNIVGVLIEAIKQQQKQIEELQEEVKSMKK